MTTMQDELLVGAAERNATCTISLPLQPIVKLRRSRILSLDEGGIWLAANADDLATIEEFIRESKAVHVAIRTTNADILFHAVPIQTNPSFLASDKRVVPAMYLKLPEKVSSSQRRRTFRVPITQADQLSVRMWRINDYVLLRDRVLPSQELICQAKDLGEGGLGVVVFANSREALNLKHNQRFRVEIKHGRHEMIFEARLRHPDQSQRDDETVSCGMEFIYNDRDVECRRHQQKLQMVLTEIQRSAVQRGET